MPSYMHPGVYVEEIASGSKPIEGVATSTALFIGYAEKGTIGEAVPIFKWDDYVKKYGGVLNKGTATNGDSMGLAVQSFYQNGGKSAYIYRLATGTTNSSAFVSHTLLTGKDIVVSAINDGDWADGLIVKISKKENFDLLTLEIGSDNKQGNFVPEEIFENLEPDSTSSQFIESVINGYSNLITVEVVDGGTQDEFRMGFSLSDDLSEASFDFSAANVADRTFSLELDGSGVSLDVVIEKQLYANGDDVAARIESQIQGQSADSADSMASFECIFVEGKLKLVSGVSQDDSAVVVDGASALSVALKLGIANGGTESTGSEFYYSYFAAATMSGGGNGSSNIDSAEYDTAFGKLTLYPDINIICLPGKSWDVTGKASVESAIAHAEAMKNRMVIVDPPSADEFTSEYEVSQLAFSTSTYAVLYYPWVKVSNSFYDAETNPKAPKTVLVPPSGFAAGMWSKIDSRRGVWKAPAGVETNMLGVNEFEYQVENEDQDKLNSLGVNCLRKLPGYGPVIWGSRTLSTKNKPEWRYVPVRRTAIYLEQSIYNGIQWAVFEPNNHKLWSSLRASIGSFMDSLFRAGAFQGETASDAYFVRCKLGDTMKQGDIDAGKVIVVVGFAPVKPAEFVIVRIQQKAGDQ